MTTGYNVYITDTTTGEERLHRYEIPSPWGEADEFMWSDGNYSCDCNRALFFAWAGDEGEPDIECGDWRFRVRITADDGHVLYEETAGTP